jgi:hypothetical protein
MPRSSPGVQDAAGVSGPLAADVEPGERLVTILGTSWGTGTHETQLSNTRWRDLVSLPPNESRIRWASPRRS